MTMSIIIIKRTNSLMKARGREAPVFGKPLPPPVSAYIIHERSVIMVKKPLHFCKTPNTTSERSYHS